MTLNISESPGLVPGIVRFPGYRNAAKLIYWTIWRPGSPSDDNVYRSSRSAGPRPLLEILCSYFGEIRTYDYERRRSPTFHPALRQSVQPEMQSAIVLVIVLVLEIENVLTVRWIIDLLKSSNNISFNPPAIRGKCRSRGRLRERER